MTVDIRPETHPDYIADITKKLPFLDETFDSVTACEVLEHFDQPTLQLHVIMEIKRILKYGGQFLMTIPNGSSFMIVLQRIVWFIREYTDLAKTYHRSEILGHVGMLPPKVFLLTLENAGFKIKEAKRLMLYDFLIVATKPCLAS